MSLTRLLYLWLGVAAITAACVDPPAARFPHRAHFTAAACGSSCLSCSTCHAPSADERRDKLPEVSVCASCHASSMARMSAIVTQKPQRASGTIHFNHDQHLGMPEINGQCIGCHAGVVDGANPSLPPMSQCFSCHEHEQQWAAGTCSPCHVQRELSALLPRTFLRHDGGFARHHGVAAASEKQLCQACHTQADCDSCHDASQALSAERRFPERIERNFVHRGGFMALHALEARAAPSRCATCHEPQTCNGCHAARGVSSATEFGRNPHPPGWVGANTQSASFHGREARRDILSCASCHEQGPATNCIRCHRVGGYGGNPHPKGRWPSAQSVSEPMCRYCHE